MRLALFLTALATTIVSSFGEYKGMTVSCQTWGIEWQMPEMEATLDELKSLGVNSVAIHPYAQIREDGHVAAGRRSGASTTHITTPLRWAHERKMTAMVIPHIAYWGTKFSWRGEINFVTPEEWDRFFAEYESWIVQMAALAESEHAELFCVGLEFSYPQKYEERWRKIIAAVRAVYHGKVTYGANWNEYADVKFWDAVDYIGVLAYFPLTKTTDPSAAEISAAWEKRCAELETFSKKNGKQFLFVEIGLQRKRARRGGAVGLQDGRRTLRGNPATLHRHCARSTGAIRSSRECSGGNGSPRSRITTRKITELQTPAIKALIAKHWK